MKNYYSIYPSPTGLTVKHLGPFEDFDAAADADELDAKNSDREYTVWIADRNDLVSLQLTIAQVLV